METPILSSKVGGANARPFQTFLNTTRQNLYLRVAPELYLKQLVIGGFEKVFEIGKQFRNEGRVMYSVVVNRNRIGWNAFARIYIFRSL